MDESRTKNNSAGCIKKVAIEFKSRKVLGESSVLDTPLLLWMIVFKVEFLTLDPRRRAKVQLI